MKRLFGGSGEETVYLFRAQVRRKFACLGAQVKRKFACLGAQVKRLFGGSVKRLLKAEVKRQFGGSGDSSVWRLR